MCDFNSDDFSLIQHITLGEKRKLFRFKFRVFSDACVRPEQEQFSKHIKTLLHNRRDSRHVVQHISKKYRKKRTLETRNSNDKSGSNIHRLKLVSFWKIVISSLNESSNWLQSVAFIELNISKLIWKLSATWWCENPMCNWNNSFNCSNDVILLEFQAWSSNWLNNCRLASESIIQRFACRWIVVI